jgi:hypothetical protein
MCAGDFVSQRIPIQRQPSTLERVRTDRAMTDMQVWERQW